ncbi:MAG TPA: ABC transporter substrate-binding protein [Gaiellaceae bacterium]|nr:ABC transporter substrate-binding protein [Gaiellaceae bacterium]
MKNDSTSFPRIELGDGPESNYEFANESSVTRGDILRRGAGIGAGLVAAGAVPGLALGKAKPKKKKPPAQPKPSGNFVLATDGTPTGMDLDPLGGTQGGEVNIALREMFFERLTKVSPSGKILPWLATAFSSNADATVWKIKLREGVVWHDGGHFSADDVVWSLKYILNTPGVSATATLQSFLAGPQSIQKLDSLTVQLNLSGPLVFLPQIFSELRLFIVRDGQSGPFNPPVGTGPFVFSNWTQGQQITGTRNPHYWQHGKPYVDQFQIQLISDPTARYNALQSGQVHALAQLPPGLLNTVKGNSNVKLLAHGGGAFGALAMRSDIAPFNDNRVRMAMKLLVNRPQMLGTAMAGAGNIANDVQNALDPDRATLKEIPQHKYDPDQAKSLLAAAGVPNLNIPLTACPTIGDYSTQIATVFSQQAQSASNISVPLDVVTSAVYQGSRYKVSPFVTVFWSARYLDEYISQSLIPGGGTQETNWSDPSFTSLWQQYRGTQNDAKRHDLAIQLQKTMWSTGPYVIPCVEDLIDCYSSKVAGINSGVIRNFNLYDFRTAHFV